jgi:hypothetical protein
MNIDIVDDESGLREVYTAVIELLSDFRAFSVGDWSCPYIKSC